MDLAHAPTNNAKDFSMKCLAKHRRLVCFASVEVINFYLFIVLFIPNKGWIYLRITSCCHPISVQYCIIFSRYSMLWTLSTTVIYVYHTSYCSTSKYSVNSCALTLVATLVNFAVLRKKSSKQLNNCEISVLSLLCLCACKRVDLFGSTSDTEWQKMLFIGCKKREYLCWIPPVQSMNSPIAKATSLSWADSWWR